MKIVIAYDHTGRELAAVVSAHIESRGHIVSDVVNGERLDYPVSAERAARLVLSGEADLGVLICGTGVGISMAANKLRGIRCVCCSEPYSARLARQHNDANMLAFGARVVGTELAKMIVDAFLDAEFEGGRHAIRVAMITALEG